MSTIVGRRTTRLQLVRPGELGANSGRRSEGWLGEPEVARPLGDPGKPSGPAEERLKACPDVSIRILSIDHSPRGPSPSIERMACGS